MLIPQAISVTFPIQIRRSQDFYFDSIVKFNCQNYSSKTMKWTLMKCSQFVCHSAIDLEPSILTTFTDLYLPAGTLALGVYELRLTVTMENVLNLTIFASNFIHIISSGSVANLVLLGTSMITIARQQNIQLNPGLYSANLDMSPFNASVSIVYKLVILFILNILF